MNSGDRNDSAPAAKAGIPLPDAAIFDMDGLLIDSESLSLRAFEHAVKAHELEESTDLFFSLVGTNEAHHAKTLQRTLSHQVDPVAFRRTWVDHYHTLTHQRAIPLLEGVPEILQWLLNNNVKTAVATSSGSSAAEKKLRDTGIRDFFQSVVCGDQVSQSKPHPEIYLKAGASIGADMSRSVGLEDSLNGVKAAAAAGLKVFHVPNIVPLAPTPVATGVQVCGSMHEVLAILQQAHATGR
jgi:HAD superfamily hydrolase (TIGR01509 family)